MNILTNRKVGMWVSALAVLLQVVTLFIGKPAMSAGTKYLGIGAGILAGVCSFIYLYKGGTKDAAIWHKLFCYLLMATLLMAFVRNIQAGKGALNSICTFLMAVIVGYLAFAKDIGKVNSMILIGVVIVLQILTVVSVIVSGNGMMVKIPSSIASSLLVLVLLCSTTAKYVDKRLRKGVEE